VANDFATLYSVADFHVLRDLAQVVVAEDLRDALAIFNNEATDLDTEAEDLALAEEHN
jgi:hypothetical protein